MALRRRVTQDVRQRVADSQESFAGGIDPSVGQNVGPLDTFAATVNMRVLPNGEIVKRPGLRLTKTEAGGIQYAHSIAGGGTSTSNLVTTVDPLGNLRTHAFSALNGTCPGASTLIAAMPAGSGQFIVPFRDATTTRAYITAPSGKVQVWDIGAGTVASLGAGTPDGIIVLWTYNKRLYGIKVDDPTLYWSGIENGDTIGDIANGGGFATIRPYSEYRIRGGFALGNYNYIVHDAGVSVFTGLTIDDISVATGTEGLATGITPLAWKVIDNIAYIVTREGLYFLAPGGSLVPYRQSVEQHDAIEAYLRNRAELYTITIADNARRSEIWITVDTATTSPVAFIFSKVHRRYTGQASFSHLDTSGTLVVRPFAHEVGPGKEDGPQLFFLVTDDPSAIAPASIYAVDLANTGLNTFKDYGTERYTSSVRLRRFYTASRRTDKAWLRASVEFGRGTFSTDQPGLDIPPKLSYVLPSASTTAVTVPDSTVCYLGQVNRLPLSGRDPYIDVTITDENGWAFATVEGWSLASVEVEAVDLGARGR